MGAVHGFLGLGSQCFGAAASVPNEAANGVGAVVGACGFKDIITTVQTWVIYNRDGYADNIAMRQTQIYQEKNYHISWISLARQDIRDIMGTAVSRLNNYMTVATLILGFTILLLVSEGNAPEWAGIMGGFIRSACFVATVSALVQLVMAILMATRAQNQAFGESLELLTTGLIPDHPDVYDWNYLHQVQQFEKNLKNVFRIPVIMPRWKLAKSGKKQSHEHLIRPELPDLQGKDLPGQKKKRATLIAQDGAVVTAAEGEGWYFQQFRQFEKVWSPWEAASRDMLAHGTSAFCQGCAYFAMGRYSGKIKGSDSGLWLSMTLFFPLIAVSGLLMLVMYSERMSVVVATCVGPAAGALAVQLWHWKYSPLLDYILVLFAFGCHVYVTGRCAGLHWWEFKAALESEQYKIKLPPVRGVCKEGIDHKTCKRRRSKMEGGPGDDLQGEDQETERTDDAEHFGKTCERAQDRVTAAFTRAMRLSFGCHLLMCATWSSVFIETLRGGVGHAGVYGKSTTTPSPDEGRLLGDVYVSEVSAKFLDRRQDAAAGSHVLRNSTHWSSAESEAYFSHQASMAITKILEPSIRAQSALGHKILVLKRELGLDISLTIKETLQEASQQLGIDNLARLLQPASQRD